MVVDRSDHRIEFVPMTDVAGVGKGAAALCFDFSSRFFALLELAADDGDIGTVVRECQRHLAPEAAAAASDQGDLAA